MIKTQSRNEFSGRFWQSHLPAGRYNSRHRRHGTTVARRVINAASRKIAAKVLGSALGLSAYTFFLGPHRVQLTCLKQPVAGLDRAFHGLRIVQLTDIHHSPWQPQDFLCALVERVNALNPDLVVLTGDYVSNSSRYIRPVANVLGQLRASAGVVGVLGNHDWYEGGAQTQKEFARSGIQLIDNARVFLSHNRRSLTTSPQGLCVAGVGDLWQDHVDIAKALDGVPREIPRLLLAHNPDVAEDEQLLSPQYRVDLMLCGHTHGGQVRLPLIGAPHVPSDYGQKYSTGLVHGGACPVYVSRGIGTSGVPLRIGAPAEIVVVELVAHGCVVDEGKSLC